MKISRFRPISTEILSNGRHFRIAALRPPRQPNTTYPVPMPAPQPPKCPKCGSPDLRPRGKRYALYPYGLVAALSLLVAIFHHASLPREFSCRQCGTETSHRSPGAGCAHAAFILGLIAVLALHAIGFLYLFAIALGQ